MKIFNFKFRKLSKNCLSKMTNRISQVTFSSLYKNVKLHQFSTDNKQEENKEIVEEITIDIDSNVDTLNSKSEGRVTLSDFYTPKSVKMGTPDINKFIDRSRFIHQNVKLGNFSRERFDKSSIGSSDNIPVSPVYEPFEVRYRCF